MDPDEWIRPSMATAALKPVWSRPRIGCPHVSRWGSYPYPSAWASATFSLWLRSSMEPRPYWLSSSTQESRLQQSTFSSLETQQLISTWGSGSRSSRFDRFILRYDVQSSGPCELRCFVSSERICSNLHLGQMIAPVMRCPHAPERSWSSQSHSLICLPR